MSCYKKEQILESAYNLFKDLKKDLKTIRPLRRTFAKGKVLEGYKNQDLEKIRDIEARIHQLDDIISKHLKEKKHSSLKILNETFLKIHEWRKNHGL